MSIAKILLFAFCFWLLCCAGQKTQLESQFLEIVQLEDEKHKLEQRYLWNLSHLEAYPEDKNLRLKQVEIKKELAILVTEIKRSRTEYDLAVKEWEGRVLESRLEKKLSDKAIRENRFRPEPE